MSDILGGSYTKYTIWPHICVKQVSFFLYLWQAPVLSVQLLTVTVSQSQYMSLCHYPDPFMNALPKQLSFCYDK